MTHCKICNYNRLARTQDNPVCSTYKGEKCEIWKIIELQVGSSHVENIAHDTAVPSELHGSAGLFFKVTLKPIAIQFNWSMAKMRKYFSYMAIVHESSYDSSKPWEYFCSTPAVFVDFCINYHYRDASEQFSHCIYLHSSLYWPVNLI